jgi:hypothetical protein
LRLKTGVVPLALLLAHSYIIKLHYKGRAKFNEWRAQFIKLFLTATNNVLTVKSA